MSDEKQDTLRDRLKRARRKRRLPPKEGHDISAEGKEVRTPSQDEFFGNLEKAMEGPPPSDQNGPDSTSER